MLQSVFLAFALYSRIPVPQAKWNEKNMRYCICFLPLVGLVIGAAQYGAVFLLAKISAGPVFSGAVLAALPVILSGGIHMDGFMDTCDAIHSWKGREERLRILKDPHAGAFAVLGCVLYLLLSAGIWSEACILLSSKTVESAGGGMPLLLYFAGFASEKSAAGYNSSAGIDALGAAGTPVISQGSLLVMNLCLCFVLSRALSAFAALVFPKAKKDGLLRQETDSAAPGAAAAMGLMSLNVSAALVMAGGIPGLCAVVTAFAAMIYYHHAAVKLFGGTTGDLAGWFLQLCELFSTAAIVTAWRFFS